MFYEPSLIDAISIRGRVAFGIACLETVCSMLGIQSASMKSLIDLFWTYIQTHELDSWESDVIDTLPGNGRDASAYSERFGYNHLTDRDQQFVTELIKAIVSVGRANLYAGFMNSLTRDETFAIATMLHARAYPVPEIERFRCSSVDEFHGWGDPIDRAAFGE